MTNETKNMISQKNSKLILVSLLFLGLVAGMALVVSGAQAQVPGTWNDTCDWVISGDSYCTSQCDNPGDYRTWVWRPDSDTWERVFMGSNSCTYDCDIHSGGEEQSCHVAHGAAPCGIGRFHDFGYTIESGCGSDTFCSNQAPPANKTACHYISAVSNWGDCVNHLQYAKSYKSPDVTWSQTEGSSCSHVALSRACNNSPIANITLPQNSTNRYLLGSTVDFAATATDPDGDPMTYSWKRGTQILSTDLQFSKSDLPQGSNSITFTATDNYKPAKSASDTVNVTMETLTVTLTATPSSGIAPLSDVKLTAVVGGSYTNARSVTYKFYCYPWSTTTPDHLATLTNVRTTTININRYTTPAGKGCTYTYGDIYLPRVEIIKGQFGAQDDVTVRVTGNPAPPCGGSVPAGSTKCNGDDLTATGASWHLVGGDSSGCTAAECEYYTPCVPASDCSGKTINPGPCAGTCDMGTKIDWCDDGCGGRVNLSPQNCPLAPCPSDQNNYYEEIKL